MTRTVFVLFSVFIILMAVLVTTANIENSRLSKKIKDDSALIDSLQSECNIKDITIGRNEFIIDELTEKHPKEVKKLYNETE
jgi:hypothetical protein